MKAPYTNFKPHQGQPVRRLGPPLEEARAVMILVHGRGAGAEDILGLAEEFAEPDVAYLAPEAADSTWYPNSFLVPIESNEPYLSSALAVLEELVAELGRQGVPPGKIILLGFSQGACLSLEFAARNAKRYGGVVALSGGLIGPPGTPRDYPGSMQGTPVFLGCGDRDTHIPVERVEESSDVMRGLDADVTERIYPNMGHTVHVDELSFIRELLATFQ